MNYSGESVYDEMSLPNGGVLRIQQKGGHGYLLQRFSTVDRHQAYTIYGACSFRRVCISTFDLKGATNICYICGQIDAALDQGVEAVSTLVLNGFDQTITSFNLRQKYKYHKV